MGKVIRHTKQTKTITFNDDTNGCMEIIIGKKKDTKTRGNANDNR